MAIGTSLGQWFPDQFSHATQNYQFSDKDNNVIDPDLEGNEPTANDKNIIDPVTKTPDFISEASEKGKQYGHGGLYGWDMLIDGAIITGKKGIESLQPKPKPDTSPSAVHPISDVIQLNPMITTENPEVRIMTGGSQVRKAANENLPADHPDRPYNDREPNMIGSRAQDESIDASWKALSDKLKKGDAIMDSLRSLNDGRKFSEFDQARYNKLMDEHRKLFPDTDLSPDK